MTAGRVSDRNSSIVTCLCQGVRMNDSHGLRHLFFTEFQMKIDDYSHFLNSGKQSDSLQ